MIALSISQIQGRTLKSAVRKDDKQYTYVISYNNFSAGVIQDLVKHQEFNRSNLQYIEFLNTRILQELAEHGSQ